MYSGVSYITGDLKVFEKDIYSNWLYTFDVRVADG